MSCRTFWKSYLNRWLFNWKIGQRKTFLALFTLFDGPKHFSFHLKYKLRTKHGSTKYTNKIGIHQKKGIDWFVFGFDRCSYAKYDFVIKTKKNKKKEKIDIKRIDRCDRWSNFMRNYASHWTYVMPLRSFHFLFRHKFSFHNFSIWPMDDLWTKNASFISVSIKIEI